MKVLSAMDGEEALSLVEDQANNVDIILMDMMMPEIGWVRGHQPASGRSPG